MKKSIIFLILSLPFNVNSKPLLPYKILSGDEIIMEIDGDGSVTKNKGTKFCNEIQKSNNIKLDDFNHKFNQNIKTSRHMGILCKQSVKVIEEQSKFLNYYCGKRDFSEEISELCESFENQFLNAVDRLNYFSGIYFSTVVDREREKIISDKKETMSY